MSEYAAYKTEFKDKACLVKALADMGYDKVEDHDVAQQLYDYHGRATTYTDKNGDKANLIVRRQFVGSAANDLGFRKNADGTWSAMVSQFDTHKHGKTWMDGLKQHYSEHVSHKSCKAQGLKFLGRKVKQDGSVELLYGKM